MNRNRPTRWRAAVDRTRVRAAHRPAQRDAIPLLDELLQIEPQIRERTSRGDQPLVEEAGSLTHSDLERTLDVRGRELLRNLFQGHLDARRPGEAVEPVRDADGVVRSRAQVHDRQLESIFGTVTVSRTGYRTEGVRACTHSMGS